MKDIKHTVDAPSGCEKYDNAVWNLFYSGYEEGFEAATKEYESKSNMRLTIESRGFMMGLSIGILALGPILWALTYILFYTFISA